MEAPLAYLDQLMQQLSEQIRDPSRRRTTNRCKCGLYCSTICCRKNFDELCELLRPPSVPDFASSITVSTCGRRTVRNCPEVSGAPTMAQRKRAKRISSHLLHGSSHAHGVDLDNLENPAEYRPTYSASSTDIDMSPVTTPRRPKSAHDQASPTSVLSPRFSSFTEADLLD